MNGKAFHVHGLEDSVLIKVPLLPKAIYGVNSIPIKIPMAFFAEINKFTQKLILHLKRLQIAKTISKKNNVGRITLDIKTYDKATVIKMV